MELPGSNPALETPLTISQFTAQVKEILETMPPCWIVGEVSKFTLHASGHRYFSLKDETSQLSCVMYKWQSRGLTFTPEPGMKVMVFGQLSVYERGGNYQFRAQRLQPAGVGELALAFEQLKARLEAEGLFAPERKRPLPRFPRQVGVVTSPTGAAIRDIINVLGRRAPGVQLILRPARVQGLGAAEEIARGIADLNRHSEVDILIVGRGGGPPEDLSCFNEEVVARAIYASPRPVISAVGHEIDYTIADYVADYRAPTPSAAAEVVAQDYGVLRQQVAELCRRLERSVAYGLEARQQRLEQCAPHRLWEQLRDLLEQQGQYADEQLQTLASAFDRRVRQLVERLDRAALRLEARSPLANLGRGFAYVQHPEGRPVRSLRELEVGDPLVLRFAEGRAHCRVEELCDE
ncbi:MAG: exodeoxyribonuclease VII large subunit [Candidatus Latescibacteria bacterium]|nr:exodeoxyribonuclease VII large subunit [Candidatus Latescibacterota bacterium]